MSGETRVASGLLGHDHRHRGVEGFAGQGRWAKPGGTLHCQLTRIVAGQGRGDRPHASRALRSALTWMLSSTSDRVLFAGAVPTAESLAVERPFRLGIARRRAEPAALHGRPVPVRFPREDPLPVPGMHTHAGTRSPSID